MKVIALLFLLPASVLKAEVAAFIGNPISARLSDVKCEELVHAVDGHAPICLSRIFDLAYEVVEDLHGAEVRVIEFIGFYHYGGLPDYTFYEPAVVVLEKTNGRWLLSRIESATRTDDGWSFCAERSDEGRCTERRNAREILTDVVPGC